jgi:YidC/Oxa1 family membrane protein insertase
MEKRLLLAVLLMSAVILISNVLFPPPKQPQKGGAAAGDTTTQEVAAPPPAAAPAAPAPAVTPLPAGEAPERTVAVTSDLYRYVFSSRGAALLRAELLRYPSYTKPGEPVQLVPEGARDFLSHRLVVGRDTLDLSRVGFQPSAPSLRLEPGSGEQSLRFTYTAPGGLGAEITYTFRPDRYVVGVSGRLLGLDGRRATLLTSMGPGLAPHESAEHHSERELAVVSRTTDDDVTRTRLGEIEGVDTLVGPLSWAGIKDKYFLAAQVAGTTPLSGGLAHGLPAVDQTYVRGGDTTVVEMPRAELVTALPVGPEGTFTYQAYLGPQEHQALAAAGQDLQEVTQYAYAWLEPIIRPFAAFILQVLDWMHGLGIAYGWVLILFGVLMRVVLWPLNAKAMRSQMKNAAVAPLMQQIREKYKDDPEKQQQEMIRLYREHGVNPLSGCLPMLLPWPVLITLFFVFQNTIAFRGASFLWLPDLSLRDPIFILPIFLVVSMFATQWVSVKIGGMEQNPQMKSMMYFMPLMMGVLFFNLPAGLNLYYATTNLASIPQQVLIAHERRRAQEEQKKNAPAEAPAARPVKRKRK